MLHILHYYYYLSKSPCGGSFVMRCAEGFALIAFVLSRLPHRAKVFLGTHSAQYSLSASTQHSHTWQQTISFPLLVSICLPPRGRIVFVLRCVSILVVLLRYCCVCVCPIQNTGWTQNDDREKCDKFPSKSCEFL